MATLTLNNSLFDAQESIWTFNCPCPSPPKQHNSHVCRFKERAHDERFSEQFSALSTLFYEKPRTKSNQQLLVEPKPVVPIYTTVAEFETLVEIYRLKICKRQCTYGYQCRNPYDCLFAHTLEEIIRPFRDERVRRFYRNVAQVKDSVYRPHTTIMQVNDKVLFNCSSLECKEREDVNLKLVYHSATLLLYPYVVIECLHCKRVTNTAVYR